MIGLKPCFFFDPPTHVLTQPFLHVCEQEGWRGRCVCAADVQLLSLGNGAAAWAFVAGAGWPLDRVLGRRLQRTWLMGFKPTVHDQLTRAATGGRKGLLELFQLVWETTAID